MMWSRVRQMPCLRSTKWSEGLKENSCLVEESKGRLHGRGTEREEMVSGKKQTRTVCCHWSLEKKTVVKSLFGY